MLDLITTHRLEVGTIKWAMEEQITKNQYANRIGVNRSQQYQDKLEANKEYLLALKEAQDHLLNMKIKELDKIAELWNQGDVTWINHLEHGKLIQVACYINLYIIYQSLKESSGYQLHLRKLVCQENKANSGKLYTIKVE